MFVNSPEKVIIGDDPANQEREEGHEEELGDKTNQGSDWLLEHLDKALYDNTKNRHYTNRQLHNVVHTVLLQQQRLWDFANHPCINNHLGHINT